jgi:cytochrome c oxidase assembly factor CtaG
MPALFNWALANPWVHAGQHASMLVTAVLFWWAVVHGRYGRLSYGVSVAFVFLTAVHTSVLGAGLTVSPQVWYRPYVHEAAAWGLDPLADQQLAGLLMWIPSGVVFIVFGLGLFAAWLGASERRALRSSRLS